MPKTIDQVIDEKRDRSRQIKSKIQKIVNLLSKDKTLLYSKSELEEAINWTSDLDVFTNVLIMLVKSPEYLVKKVRGSRHIYYCHKDLDEERHNEY